MIHGILVVIGIIGIICSRFMYYCSGGSYKDDETIICGGIALGLDILCTAMVALSLLDYYGVINI